MPNKIPHNELVVVITGASSGFGKGMAEQLAAKGTRLVIAARRTELIEQLARKFGEHVLPVTADISRPADVEKIYRAAMEAFGRIDVWVNNAGVIAAGLYTDIPLEDITRVIEINLLGTMYGSHFALRQFKHQGYGTLINMASASDKMAFPYLTPYSASKFGVAGFSEGLYEEMKLTGYENIHVCAVNPWVTDTPWPAHAANYSGHELHLKPVDDPQTVIDAMIDLIDNPKKSVEIGLKVKGAAATKNLMPNMTDKLSAKYLQHLIENAPPAAATSGNLHTPVPGGTTVAGELRQRIKDAEKKGKT